MINIAEINLNEGEGRQTIYYNPEDGKLYTSFDDSPIDDYSYASLDEAIEATDIMWGRSDIVGAWGLEWIESEEV